MRTSKKFFLTRGNLSAFLLYFTTTKGEGTILLTLSSSLSLSVSPCVFLSVSLSLSLVGSLSLPLSLSLLVTCSKEFYVYLLVRRIDLRLIALTYEKFIDYDFGFFFYFVCVRCSKVKRQESVPPLFKTVPLRH